MATYEKCKICGGEMMPGRILTINRSAHGYCYDVNRDFARGSSRMHFEKEDGSAVVPEVDGEGYLTGGYATISRDGVATKVRQRKASLTAIQTLSSRIAKIENGGCSPSMKKAYIEAAKVAARDFDTFIVDVSTQTQRSK